MALEIDSTYTMAGMENKSFGLAVGKRLSIQTSGTATVGRFSSGSLVESATVTNTTRIFGEYAVPMRFVVSADSYPVTAKIGAENGGSFTYDAIGNATGLVDPAGNVITSRVHPYYFFHGYAGNHVAGDDKFLDMAAGNHGVRGANLSDSEMFANAGFITTKAPANPYDICARIPNLNFDYSAGEKLFVWWRGKITPEADERAFIGDGFGTGTSGNGQRGIQIRVNQSGKLTAAIYGAAAKAMGLSNAIPFDGAIHDIGVFLDGSAKSYGYWIDGAMDSSFAGSLTVLDTVAYDTKNGNTFNLGASAPAAGSATAPQSGIATQTRALVIIRLPASYVSPSVSSVTNACKALRVNPGKLLLAGAL